MKKLYAILGIRQQPLPLLSGLMGSTLLALISVIPQFSISCSWSSGCFSTSVLLPRFYSRCGFLQFSFDTCFLSSYSLVMACSQILYCSWLTLFQGNMCSYYKWLTLTSGPSKHTDLGQMFLSLEWFIALSDGPR